MLIRFTHGSVLRVIYFCFFILSIIIIIVNIVSFVFYWKSRPFYRFERYNPNLYLPLRKDEGHTTCWFPVPVCVRRLLWCGRVSQRAQHCRWSRLFPIVRVRAPRYHLWPTTHARTHAHTRPVHWRLLYCTVLCPTFPHSRQRRNYCDKPLTTSSTRSEYFLWPERLAFRLCISR